MGWPKYIIGGLLMVGGIAGIAYAFLVGVLAQFVPSLSSMQVAVWPAIGLGIVGFLVFITGKFTID